MTIYAKMTRSNRLTLLELEAVVYAMGNTTDHWDAMEAVFLDPVERAAAQRGAKKLHRALWFARQRAQEKSR